MPIKRFHLLPIIVLLAASFFNGCGDADDSYVGDPIEVLEEEAEEQDKQVKLQVLEGVDKHIDHM